MDWQNALLPILAIPVAALLWRWRQGSLHPMSQTRQRALLGCRCALALVILLALAGPAVERLARDEAAIFVLDTSDSLGESGRNKVVDEAKRLIASAPPAIGHVSAGLEPQVLAPVSQSREVPDLENKKGDVDKKAAASSQTDLASAVAVARGLFPPGVAKRLVLLSDGMETRGDLLAEAREAAADGVAIDILPVAGEKRPDVRVTKLQSSRARLHEGASLLLTAEVESTLAGKGRLRLFENSIEVESREIELKPGEVRTETFHRTPDHAALHAYSLRAEGFPGDSLPGNNSALAIVDVRGRPVFLHIEGEPSEAKFLVESMAHEGLSLHTIPPEAFPVSVQDLASFDGVILSDVPSHRLPEKAMACLRDYVELFGGGFLMIGGASSFGAGGYYRTPVEEILPVKLRALDDEERFATALALVIDRSGSMDGQKLEICKSAAIATSELLSGKDFLGVVAFDSSPTWITPMSRVADKSAIRAQISAIDSGGGTHIYPAMDLARSALAEVSAKVKHAIVLTDGQTMGEGYEALAAQMKSQNITVSTVAVGQEAAADLLQAIAASGGGKFYLSLDPSNIPRIFTQDAMTHLGKVIREEEFIPQQAENHPMLKGWTLAGMPPLLGYVKTVRKSTAQSPLVTDLGMPLLAHWRFGLGKVTAFTSDCKSRWSSLWLATARERYAQFWAQVLRETAREPQGRRIDLRIEPRDGRAWLAADVQEDAAHFRDGAEVEAEVFYLPDGMLGTGIKRVAKVKLDQDGPGLYKSYFQPDKPGIYLARARCGAELVSAGLVHANANEASTGTVNQGLLEETAKITGGHMLSPEQALPPLARPGHARFEELRPWLIRLALLLFAADLILRRWENALGFYEFFFRRGEPR